MGSFFFCGVPELCSQMKFYLASVLLAVQLLFSIPGSLGDSTAEWDDTMLLACKRGATKALTPSPKVGCTYPENPSSVTKVGLQCDADSKGFTGNLFCLAGSEGPPIRGRVVYDKAPCAEQVYCKNKNTH